MGFRDQVEVDETELREGLQERGESIKPASKKRFERTAAALTAYKLIHGDMLVPWKFIVPRNSEYPEDTWDMKLGEVVSKIRNFRYYEEHHDRLREMGFEFGAMSDLQFEKVEAALTAYKLIHGDMLVPHRFVVPRSSEYPEDT